MGNHSFSLNCCSCLKDNADRDCLMDTADREEKKKWKINKIKHQDKINNDRSSSSRAEPIVQPKPIMNNDLSNYPRANQPKRKGIPNIGNTGYLNSVIQALASTKSFPKILKWTTSEELISLRNLIQELYRDTINLINLAKDFKDKISKSHPNFEGSSQNGAKELLEIIFEIIDKSMIENPFNIRCQKKFMCKMGHSWGEDEILKLIIIPNGENEISAYIKEMNMPIHLQNKTKTFCAICNKFKKTIIGRQYKDSPKFMAFYLSRDEGEKINMKIDMKFMFGGNMYALYAVICYDWIAQHFYECEIADQANWHKYDDIDTSIKRIDWDDDPYLLFYERNGS